MPTIASRTSGARPSARGFSGCGHWRELDLKSAVGSAGKPASNCLPVASTLKTLEIGKTFLSPLHKRSESMSPV